jgi:hypothetical protein
MVKLRILRCNTFENITNYLEKLQKDAFAMIHQLGPPTFFLTFISAESR